MKTFVAAAAACAAASVSPAFAGFDEVISFSEPGVIAGTAVDGVSIKNVTFGFGFGDKARGIDTATFNGGPTPDIGIEGPTTGRLEFSFHQPVSAFGFSFSLLATGLIGNAASVGFLDADGNVNKFFFPADSDPLRGDGPVPFSSGFVNISSQVPIVLGFVDFAQSTDGVFFRGSDPIERFFVDNLGYDFAGRTIPLPTPAFLGAVGLAGLASLRRRRTL